MTSLTRQYVTSQEAARILGINPRALANMAAAGRLPGAEKVAYRWLVHRDTLTEFARTYEARRGRPRTKRNRSRRRQT